MLDHVNKQLLYLIEWHIEKDNYGDAAFFADVGINVNEILKDTRLSEVFWHLRDYCGDRMYEEFKSIAEQRKLTVTEDNVGLLYQEHSKHEVRLQELQRNRPNPSSYIQLSHTPREIPLKKRPQTSTMPRTLSDIVEGIGIGNVTINPPTIYAPTITILQIRYKFP